MLFSPIFFLSHGLTCGAVRWILTIQPSITKVHAFSDTTGPRSIAEGVSAEANGIVTSGTGRLIELIKYQLNCIVSLIQRSIGFLRDRKPEIRGTITVA